MRVTIASLDVPVPGSPGSTALEESPLGLLVVAPADEKPYPGLLFYTDIFGRNPSSVRMMMRFASYGFTVVSPDLYRRIEPLGVALDFVADYDRAQRDASATTVASFDADRALALAAMRAHPRIDASAIGVVGFCIGGHLALRAAADPGVAAIVAYYPTGLHDDSLGASSDATTLAMLPASPARLYLAFGGRDPHTDPAGRALIAERLGASETRCVASFDGEHAFMRDEGPRYDPELTDRAFAAGIDWLRRA